MEVENDDKNDGQQTGAQSKGSGDAGNQTSNQD